MGRSGLGGTLLCQAPLRVWDFCDVERRPPRPGAEPTGEQQRNPLTTEKSPNARKPAAVVIYSSQEPGGEGGKLVVFALAVFAGTVGHQRI